MENISVVREGGRCDFKISPESSFVLPKQFYLAQDGGYMNPNHDKKIYIDLRKGIQKRISAKTG